MPVRTVIIGAGLIGAAIAYELTRAGRDVLIVDAGLPGGGASGRSFGWINASFYHDVTHHHLRRAGMQAWRALQGDMPDLAVRWPGCLWWEAEGAELAQMQATLGGLGYAAERRDGPGLAAMLPADAPAPAEALFFAEEGVAEPGIVTAQLLAHARAGGAQILSGCMVEAIETKGGQITGLRCEGGSIAADRVIVAAGVGSTALVEPLGVTLPLLRRPGVLMMTQPVAPVLNHIMVAPELEFRQAPDGRIIAPGSASHQGDDTEYLGETVQDLAADALARVRRYLPGMDLRCEQATYSHRPVPGDGLPVIGPCGPAGMYLACLHSGITLGALVGKLVAQEVLNGTDASQLVPYRPGRFASA